MLTSSLYTCLLYTSDAADERSSVDLGGRRIIKKKKNIQTRVCQRVQKKDKTSTRTDENTNNNNIEQENKN